MLSGAKLRALQSSVPDDVAPIYLAEAIACYRQKAYRACTVMVSNAVFDDLLRKLRHLVEVNKKLRKTLTDADFRRGEGASFEYQLAEELKNADVLTSKQWEYLEELRLLRNDAAHPCGKSISAAKAGYLVEEGVRLFLAEVSLNPKAVVTEIIARIKTPGLFPRGDRASSLLVVRHEMARLDPEAYHLLIRGVVGVLAENDPVSRRNASEFLQSCMLLKIPELSSAVVLHLMVPKLTREDGAADPYSRAIYDVLSASPRCVEILSEAQRLQLDSKIASYCRELKGLRGNRRSPVSLLKRLLRVAPSLVESSFSKTAGFVVDNYPCRPEFLAALERPGRIRGLILHSFRRLATSPSMPEALEFFRFAETHAARIASRLEDGEAYALLLAFRAPRALGLEYANGLEAMLQHQARDWFDADRAAASKFARQMGLIDPAEYWPAEAPHDDRQVA